MLDHFIARRFSNSGRPPEANLCTGTTPELPFVNCTLAPRVCSSVKPELGLQRTRFSASSRYKRGVAFTLVEMLVVMAIVVILVSLVVPATASLLRNLQIGQNGQLIESQLDLARQAALSNNRSVEVRLCQVNGKFSAILPLLVTNTVNATNTNQPVYQTIGKPTFISDSVLIDSGTTLSSLVSPNGASAIAPASNYSNPPLGSFGQNYKYVSFKFKPDGTTDLNQSSLWFLTVHSATDPDPGTVPPSNFYTIQVDPYNGHVSQFRP